MIAGDKVRVKKPITWSYAEGILHSHSHVDSETGEQVWWVEFWPTPGRSQKLMYGETEFELTHPSGGSAGAKEWMCGG